MKIVSDQLTLVREHIEAAAFLTTKENAAKQAHAELVAALVELEKAVRALASPSTAEGADTVNQIVRRGSAGELASASLAATQQALVAAEVDKVRRRLSLWARPERQGQYNATILNAFLKLTNGQEVRAVSEAELRRELGKMDSFDVNFVQMKTSAEKNHGKVFDQRGQMIVIWEPVLPLVQAYEKTVANARSADI